MPNTSETTQAQKRAMVQRLLSEIYHRYNAEKQLDSSTETSCLSDGVHGLAVDSESILKQEQNQKLQFSVLQSRDMEELHSIKQGLDERIIVMSTKLVRQLKQRNRLRDKNKRYCDTITAVLQAVSKKRKEDTKLQFNMQPAEGEEGFKQWCDALRAIVRLPGGLPACWRKRIWISLADHYVGLKHPKMSQVLNRVFSDRICPADESLGNQIVKDLHRTGYSNLSASEEGSDDDRLVLKRVLLAYARWNQAVGYCQGFNVLAALILQVTEGDDEAAFKIMVHLVDGVLPENYFANNLQGLSVDMAVFRDLMKVRLPQLSRHLDALQREANQVSTGSNYEPPLTNVFTMQWFLTLFATCLPADTVLRIWDSVMLDGNEIVLRVALAIWAKLGERIGETHSADDFYCRMSELMQSALNGRLINGNELTRLAYRVASFPFPHLNQLREKYTYNITPFAAENHDELRESDYRPINSLRHAASPDVTDDYDDAPFSCFGGFASTVPSPPSHQDKKKPSRQSLELASSSSIRETFQVPRGNGMMAERMSTDIAALKNQYMSIRSRQLKAHLVYTKPVPVCHSSSRPHKTCTSPKIHPPPIMVNHLLIGRKETKKQSMSPVKVKDRFPTSKKHTSTHKRESTASAEKLVPKHSTTVGQSSTA